MVKITFTEVNAHTAGTLSKTIDRVDLVEKCEFVWENKQKMVINSAGEEKQYTGWMLRYMTKDTPVFTPGAQHMAYEGQEHWYFLRLCDPPVNKEMNRWLDEIKEDEGTGPFGWNKDVLHTLVGKNYKWNLSMSGMLAAQVYRFECMLWPHLQVDGAKGMPDFKAKVPDIGKKARYRNDVFKELAQKLIDYVKRIKTPYIMETLVFLDRIKQLHSEAGKSMKAAMLDMLFQIRWNYWNEKFSAIGPLLRTWGIDITGLYPAKMVAENFGDGVGKAMGVWRLGFKGWKSHDWSESDDSGSTTDEELLNGFPEFRKKKKDFKRTGLREMSPMPENIPAPDSSDDDGYHTPATQGYLDTLKEIGVQSIIKPTRKAVKFAANSSDSLWSSLRTKFIVSDYLIKYGRWLTAEEIKDIQSSKVAQFEKYVTLLNKSINSPNPYSNFVKELPHSIAKGIRDRLKIRGKVVHTIGGTIAGDEWLGLRDHERGTILKKALYMETVNAVEDLVETKKKEKAEEKKHTSHIKKQLTHADKGARFLTNLLFMPIRVVESTIAWANTLYEGGTGKQEMSTGQLVGTFIVGLPAALFTSVLEGLTASVDEEAEFHWYKGYSRMAYKTDVNLEKQKKSAEELRKWMDGDMSSIKEDEVIFENEKIEMIEV